ncbi:MAG: MBL fold metallo-hydrolase [Firmicutes bacterium]|nr:MBL fold metallo-hydrolase [Bacillota bacterium]
MKVIWIGHACFKIESQGASILFDPYEDGSVPGLDPVREEADLVFVSHEHFDHNARKNVSLSGKTALPFCVKTLDTYHDDRQGALRGSNRITIVDDGSVKLAHLGDLGCELEPEQMEELTGLDVVLVPIGGFYTIDASQAASLVKRLKPRYVIPMHFRDDGLGFGFDVIGCVEDFVQAMGSAAFQEASAVEIGPSGAEEKEIPAEPRVLVLEPANLSR